SKQSCRRCKRNRGRTGTAPRLPPCGRGAFVPPDRHNGRVRFPKGATMSGLLEHMTAVDLAERFGPIPLWRIRTNPEPGNATEDDVIAIHERENRACELIDGILVEKDVSTIASLIATRIAKLLSIFVDEHGLGFVLGEQGKLRLSYGQVRIPDVSFIRADQVPGGEFPTKPIANLIPTLAVEVLSPGNTEREMNEKLDEYFASGSELVWYV